MAKIITRFFPKIRYGIYFVILVLTGLAATPVPMHGGFSFLLFDLIDEARRDYSNYLEERKKEQIQRKIISRFAGVLDYSGEQSIENSKNWYRVKVNEQSAYLDRQSGLIWTSELSQVSGYDVNTLSRAEKICNEMNPKGYWVVPNDAEAYFIKKNRGENLFADGFRIWLVRVVISREQAAILGMTKFGKLGKPNPSQVYGVRCVGLSKYAPRAGYQSDDIPLNEWNEYQLSKGY